MANGNNGEFQNKFKSKSIVEKFSKNENFDMNIQQEKAINYFDSPQVKSEQHQNDIPGTP
jgi:hypothetical protein